MKRQLTWTLIIAMAALPLFGQIQSLEPIARWAQGPCNAAYSTGGYLYMGNGCYLDIYDASTYAQISRTLMPGVVKDIYVSLGNAYLTLENEGFAMAFVADPANVYLSGTFTDIDAGHFMIQGSYAFVACGDSSLNILRITQTQATPRQYSIVRDSRRKCWAPVNDVFVPGTTAADTVAYVAVAGQGLFSFGVNTKTTPFLLDSLANTGNSASALFVRGTHAFVAAPPAGLWVVDISDPTNLFNTSSWDPIPTPDIQGTDVFVDASASNAYIADAAYGLRIVDLSTIGTLTEKTGYATTGTPTSVFLDGNNLYLADAQRGLKVLNVAGSPTLAQSVISGGVTQDALIDTGYVYVAGGNAGFRVLDRTSFTSDSIRTVARIDTFTSSVGLAMIKNTLFLANGPRGLKKINIQNPAAPVVQAHIATSTSINGVAAYGDSLLIATEGSTIRKIDVFSATTPPPNIGTPLNLSLATRNVTVDAARRLAFVATATDGVHVINLNSTGSAMADIGIARTGTTNDAWASAVSITGDTLYVADGTNGVRMYDIADSTLPALIKTYNTTGSAYDLVLKGATALIADGAGTVRMVDFSKTTPLQFDSLHTDGTSFGVDMANDTLAIADGDAGVILARGQFAGILQALSDTLDFGNVLVGHSRQLGLKVTNVGFNPVQLTDVYSPSGRFVAQAGYSTILYPSDTTTIRVTFNCNQADLVRDSLIIGSDASNNPIDVEMKGFGITNIPLAAYTPDRFAYGLYHMDTLTGDTLVVDGSSYGYLDGKASGGIRIPGADSSKFANAYLFSGSSAVNVPLDSLASLPAGSGVSFDLWFNAISAMSGRKTLATITNNGLSYIQLAIEDSLGLNRKLIGMIKYSAADSVVIKTPITKTIALDTWHHAALTHGDSLILYLNGARMASAYSSSWRPNPAMRLNIGNDTTGVAAHAFPGLIDEVRVSGIAREPWEFNTGAVIASTVNSVNFQTVTIDSVRRQIIGFTNNGYQTLVISDINKVRAAYSLSDTAFQIAPGATAYDTLSFRPTNTGVFTDELVVLSNDPVNSPLRIPITGIGVALPNITVDSTAVRFGSVQTGSTLTAVFRINNEGGQTLTVSDINWTNSTYSLSDTTFQLAPGESDYDTLTFHPTHSGTYLDTLVLLNNDPLRTPLRIPVSGTATGQLGTVTLLDDSLDFGNVVVGKNRHISLNLTNTGTDTVHVSNVYSTTGYFTWDDNRSQTTIPPEDTADIRVYYHCQQYETLRDSLFIISDASNPRTGIKVKGFGVSSTPLTQYSPDPFAYALYHLNTLAGPDSAVQDTSSYGYLDGRAYNVKLVGSDSSKFNKAHLFNGSAAVDIPVDSLSYLPEWDGISFDLWFNLLSVLNGRKTLAIITDSGQPFFQLAIEDSLGANRKLVGRIKTSTTDSVVIKSSVSKSIGLNAWHHAALTFGDSLTLYLNGDRVAAAYASSLSRTTGVMRMRIGNDTTGSGTHMFPGLIDEVRVSGIAREPWEFNVSTGRLQLATEGVNFGAVQIGGRKTQYVSLRNSGAGPLWIDSLKTNSTLFQVGSGSAMTLASGESRWVALTFSPVTSRDTTAFLSIYSKDVTTPIRTLSMSGQGTSVQPSGAYAVDANTSGLWHLDGVNPDTTMGDAGANGLGGTFRTGRANWNQTIKRYGTSSLHMVNDSGWVSVPYNASIDYASTPFTLETWFYLDQKPGAGKYYVLARRGTGDQTQYELTYGDSLNTVYGLVGRVYNASGTAFTVLGPPDSTMNDSTWYHVAFSWDLDSLRLYVNGIQQQKTAFSGTALRSSTTGLSVGGNYGVGRGFRGYLDEIRFSNTARQPWEFGAGPVFSSSFVSVDFDSVELNTTASRILIFSNTGYQTLTITDINKIRSEYTLSDTSFQIAAGASAADTLRFRPTALGAFPDTLIVTCNDALHSPIRIPVTGVGVSPPQIAVSRDTVDFGIVQTGESASETITISNTGGRALIVSDINWRNTAVALTDTGFQILPGANRTIAVLYAPVSVGALADTLRIFSNDPAAARDTSLVKLFGEGRTYRAPKVAYVSDDYTAALYHLDENAGTAANDTSANNHTGTLAGGASWTTGYYKSGAHLDGVNDMITIPTAADLSFDLNAQSFTVECFFKTDTVHSTLFFKGPVSTTTRGNYGLLINTNGYLDAYGFSSFVYPHAPVYVADGVWHHAALVYNAVTKAGTVYLDGNVEMTGTWVTGSTSLTGGPLVFGAQQTGSLTSSTYGRFFEGDLDEMRVSSKIRKPWEFAYNPSVGVTISTTSPKAGIADTLSIQVTGATPTSVTVFHRQTGAATFDTLAATSIAAGTYRAVIAGTKVTHRGLEYYVRKITATDTVMYPVYDPTNRPLAATVSFDTISSGLALSKRKYAMVSVPAGLTQSNAGQVLTDDLGARSIFDWRLFAWSDTSYKEYGDSLGYADSLLFRFTQGKAFWLVTGTDKTFDVAKGTSSPSDAPFQMELATQWNMLGNPFAFNVAWDDCAASSDSLTGTLYSYDGKGYRSDVAVMEPWKGYWFYNADPYGAMLRVPPKGTTVELSKAAQPRRGVLASLSEADWVWQLSVVTPEAEDLDNFMGVRADARADWDSRDRMEPPPIGDYVSMFVNHGDWIDQPGRYGADIREPGESGYVWNLQLQTLLAGQSVELAWNIRQSMPEGWVAYLVDEAEGQCVNLSEKTRMTFKTEKTTPNNRLFKLIAGTPEFVQGASEVPLQPMAFALLPNYPNPFNPETRIQYTLPKNGRVHLAVYNMLGQKVLTLLDEKQKAGLQQITWEGTSENGNRVPSGIYFTKLEFEDRVLVRKMVLVK